jgi:16S rRNA A1518/A1519 N6-dimethyltransferase RsmA/KsgA/DIM1 with predicted DNA glycosylase/AP lyase activity
MGLDGERFMDFVRSAFSQRRKVLSNALASWGARCNIPVRVVAGSVDLTKTRAEELSPEKLAMLYLELNNS